MNVCLHGRMCVCVSLSLCFVPFFVNCKMKSCVYTRHDTKINEGQRNVMTGSVQINESEECYLFFYLCLSLHFMSMCVGYGANVYLGNSCKERRFRDGLSKRHVTSYQVKIQRYNIQKKKKFI